MKILLLGGPRMELPLWLKAHGKFARLHEADVSRALAAGLRFRPLRETMRDTLGQATLTDEAGLRPERERELLAAGHELQ